MAVRTVIVREAPDADLPDLARFLQRELTAWGFDAHTTTATVRALFKARRRYAYVTEDDAIVAVGTFHPIETQLGPTYEIPLFLGSTTHPDRLRIMDALALFICNRLRSEGILHLITFQPDHPHVTGLFTRYGFVQPEGADWSSVKTETPVANILRERPEWRPSP